MLASVFVSGGVRTLRHPEHAAKQAEPVSERITAATEHTAPWLPTGPVALVRANAAVQVGGAALLASGKLPRLAALALAASLVPTTVVGHAWWRYRDPAQRAHHRNHFLKNVAILGGLALTAVDTQGRPGLGWRASQATGTAAKRVGRLRRRAVERVTP